MKHTMAMDESCLDIAGLKSYVMQSGDEDDVQRRERIKKAMRNALVNELTPRQRQAVMMYYFDGLDMESVAGKMGVTKGTVSRTIKRGRLRIEKLLKYLW